LLFGKHGEEDTSSVSLFAWIDDCLMAKNLSQPAVFVQQKSRLEDETIDKPCKSAKDDGYSHLSCNAGVRLWKWDSVFEHVVLAKLCPITLYIRESSHSLLLHNDCIPGQCRRTILDQQTVRPFG
jgi:hypothetical protein